MKKRRLAIIPARGGSKRIPRKNIKPFLGKPIILHVLEKISGGELFDQLHVSTEDREILEIVSAAGFSPPFSRDPLLAGDHTPLSQVLRSVVQRYREQGERFDTIVLIFATAVLLEPETLSRALLQFESMDGSAEMISVAKYPVPIEWAMRMEPSGEMTPVQREKLSVRSQDLHEAWYETAEFVLYDEESLFAEHDTPPRIGFPVSHLSIDIDTMEDWAMAERIARVAG
jgi:pseudaminic acid cytidylyltransferase